MFPEHPASEVQHKNKLQMQKPPKNESEEFASDLLEQPEAVQEKSRQKEPISERSMWH